MDVVFPVTAGDRDAVERAVGNAETLLADETVDVGSVALVANGDAVAHLGAGSDLATDVTVLLDRGVAVKACGNTLERRGESQTDLVVGVEVVPRRWASSRGSRSRATPTSGRSARSRSGMATARTGPPSRAASGAR